MNSANKSSKKDQLADDYRVINGAVYESRVDRDNNIAFWFLGYLHGETLGQFLSNEDWT
jgi:hypothetical protein